METVGRRQALGYPSWPPAIALPSSPGTVETATVVDIPADAQLDETGSRTDVRDINGTRAQHTWCAPWCFSRAGDSRPSRTVGDAGSTRQWRSRSIGDSAEDLTVASLQEWMTPSCTRSNQRLAPAVTRNCIHRVVTFGGDSVPARDTDFKCGSAELKEASFWHLLRGRRLSI